MDIIIGLIGAKGAGKTTAFNAIQQVLNVQEITLAAKLKDVSSAVFGVPRDHFDSHQYKEKEMNIPVFLTPISLTNVFNYYKINTTTDGFYDKFVRPHVGKILLSPRQIAQYIGTEVLRNYEEDIHCLSACREVTKSIGVVTDMRFPNEYEYFSKNYQRFYTIYVQNMAAEMSAGKDTHASEAYLRDLAKRANVTLPNNSSMHEFERLVQLTLTKEFHIEVAS